MAVEYVFSNADNKSIRFIQHSLDASSFHIDSEHSDNTILEIENYTIYTRKTGNMYYYLWNDGIYAFQMNSSERLSNDELLLIIDGLKIKQ